MQNSSLNSFGDQTSSPDIRPTVSLAAALDIVEGDVAILQQIVPGVLTRALDLLDQLQTAVTERNYAKVELLAHRLRSGLGNVGGLAALDFAHQLEDRAANANLDHGQEILNSLAEQIEGVIVFYTNPVWPHQALEQGLPHG